MNKLQFIITLLLSIVLFITIIKPDPSMVFDESMALETGYDPCNVYYYVKDITGNVLELIK